MGVRYSPLRRKNMNCKNSKNSTSGTIITQNKLQQQKAVFYGKDTVQYMSNHEMVFLEMLMAKTREIREARKYELK